MKLWGILLTLPCLVLAQPEFFGYFESEADVMQLGSKQYNYGYHKFRLDIEARPNDYVQIGANINVQHYWGKTTWNIFDFIPGYADSGMEMNYQLPDTMVLDNVFMKLSFPLLDLTVGRQQISPGVGYAWNPTDIFNHKTLMDPSYEQSGVSGIRVEIPLPANTNMTTFFQPYDEWSSSSKQLWLSSGLGHFDIELTAAEYLWDYFNLSSIHKQKRTLLGLSLVGEVAGIGTWIEAAQNESDRPTNFGGNTISWIEVTAGVDYTFENSIYVLGEFLHNELGVAQEADLTLSSYLYSLEGITHSLMQDYGFFYIMHPTYDYVSLSALAIANFNDNSGTLAPQLDWNAFEDTNISLQTSFSWGDKDTEFGLQDWGLRLRLRSDF